MRLIVHSKTGCPWCDQAKAYLNERNLPFEELLHDDDQERQVLYDSLGLLGLDRTVPQVVLIEDDGEQFVIGGYQALTMSGVHSLKHLGLGDAERKAQQAEARMKAETYAAERAALRGEPVFSLRPTDMFAVEVAEFWLSKVTPGLGDNHPKIASARKRIAMIKLWQQEHGCKHPD